MQGVATHMPYPVSDAERSYLYVSLSQRPVTRLVVFVHGFRGRAVGTWREFPDVQGRDWWEDADLLFIGYDSTRENITGVANRLRAGLERFYPAPLAEAMSVDGVAPRSHTGDYEELYLVGHSLGGLVVRRALCDAADQWIDLGRQVQKPAILYATVRLFSPASAGFRAAGILGMIKASGVWAAVEIFVRRSSAYTDLQPKSITLKGTRRRTERLAAVPGCEALRAWIVWANPDDVVIPDGYDSDHVGDSWDGTTHSKVCKPRRTKFEAPWRFVESGETR